MTDPNAGTWSFAYDAAGNLSSYHDANGNDLYYGYDPANRLRWEKHGSPGATNDVTYHYDAPYQMVGGQGQLPNGQPQDYVLGRLAWVEDASGTRFTSFDQRGRAVVDLRHMGGSNGYKQRTRGYDALDREVARTWPDSIDVSFVYSARGLLEEVPGYVPGIVYNAAGQPVLRMLYDGGETQGRWRYDAVGRLVSVQAEQNEGPVTLLDRLIELDRVGNVVSLRRPTPEAGPLESQEVHVTRDGYDALYRLRSAWFTYAPENANRVAEVSYGYDRVGNLTSMQADQGGFPDTHFGSATYNSGTYQLAHAEQGSNTVDALYDANGNVTSLTTVDVTRDQQTVLALTWNQNNQLVHVAKSTGPAAGPVTLALDGDFVYDHAGQLATQTLTPPGWQGDVTAYYADDSEVRHGDELTKYVFVGGERLVKRVDEQGTTTLPGLTHYQLFYHSDMLHTAAVVTDRDGNLVEQRQYLPYGQPEADASLSPYGTYREPYGFTGKEYDAAFGLQYFGARWYAPGLGRWLSADPLYLLNPERGADEVAELNLYGYCAGKALSAHDPSGTWLKAALAAIAAPAIGLVTVASHVVRDVAASPAATRVVNLLSSQGGNAGRALPAARNALVNAPTASEVVRRAPPVVANTLRAVQHIQAARGDRALRGVVEGAKRVGEGGGAEAVRLGRAGEAAVRTAENIGPKVRIEVAGRLRIPDGLTTKTLSEVKNVQSLSYTQQLRDFASYASQKGLRFNLWVRPMTQLSQPLCAPCGGGHDQVEAYTVKKRAMKRISAGELMAKLEADRSTALSRARAQEEEFQRRAAELRRAEAPLVEELRKAGYSVESAWDLVNTAAPYPEALPILLDHLARPYPPPVREGIARALAVPEAKFGWSVLVRLFREEREKRVKDGLACAIAEAADDEVIGDVIALVRARQHSSRVFLLSALERSADPRARATLMDLGTDPELKHEVQLALRRLKRTKSGSRSSPQRGSPRGE